MDEDGRLNAAIAAEDYGSLSEILLVRLRKETSVKSALDFIERSLLPNNKGAFDEIGWDLLCELLNNCIGVPKIFEQTRDILKAICKLINPKLSHLSLMESLQTLKNFKSVAPTGEEIASLIDLLAITLQRCQLSFVGKVLDETLEMLDHFVGKTTDEELILESYLDLLDSLGKMCVSDARSLQILRDSYLDLFSNFDLKQVCRKIRIPVRFNVYKRVEDFGRSVYALKEYNQHKWPAIFSDKYRMSLLYPHFKLILNNIESKQITIFLETFSMVVQQLPKKSMDKTHLDYVLQDQGFMTEFLRLMSQHCQPEFRQRLFNSLEKYLGLFEESARMEFYINIFSDCPFVNVQTAMIQLFQKCILNSRFHGGRKSVSVFNSRVVVDLVLPLIFEFKHYSKETAVQQKNLSYYQQALNFFKFLLICKDRTGDGEIFLGDAFDDLLIGKITREFVEPLKRKLWDDEDEFSVSMLHYCVENISEILEKR